MKTIPIRIVLSYVVITSCYCGLESAEPQRLAKNPIIYADVPDVAVIRVGNIYYMSSTTMHFNPGLPIMKSTNLVDWEIISYAYNILEDNDALNLRNGKNCYGGGSWASSLRYHKGVFYATTFSHTTGKTYIFTTEDPEKGIWKVSSFKPALHDHSLFFDDDGRVYMIHGSGNIRLTELLPELTGIKPGGLDMIIITNASKIAGDNIGLPAEGSQMHKINGKYYLMNITWPKGGMRTELIFRADKITGPYEGRIALQDKGVAQGGLIDTPEGKWYAMLFQDHGAVGRIPFLVPVKWVDGWPIFGVDGKVPEMLDLEAGNLGISGIVMSDEFDYPPGTTRLKLAWQWNHNPDNNNWSLSARPGFLRIITGRIDTDIFKARNTLTQRTFGPECSAEVCMDITNMKDGDYAGLAAFQKNFGFVGIKSDGENKKVVMVKSDTTAHQVIESIPLTQNIVYLKMECDFKKRTDKAYFYYSLNGKEWKKIGEPLQMTYTIPHFTGYRFALFNYATKTTGGFVDFDYFRVDTKMMAEK